MQSLVEYLNESLIMELSSETYLNAAKKAKLKGDPRVEKFMHAFLKAVEKEFDGTPQGDSKMNEYYRKDKKIFTALKKLSSNSGDTCVTNSKGELEMNYEYADKLGSMDFNGRASALVGCDTKNKIGLMFFRKYTIPEQAFKNIMDEMSQFGMKESDFDNDNPMTYIGLYTNTSTIGFFYFIDTDHFVGEFMRNKEGTFKGKDILDNINDGDRKALNKLLSTINPKHKDI